METKEVLPQWSGTGNKRIAARVGIDVKTVRRYVNAAGAPRKQPGDRSIDESDFPPHKRAYALRDGAFLERQAAEHGEAIGRFAHALLDVPLPWTRMRRVYALLGLVRRYGAERVEQTCRVALEAEMHDVNRLERMLRAAVASAPTTTTPKNVPPALPPAARERVCSAFAVQHYR